MMKTTMANQKPSPLRHLDRNRILSPAKSALRITLTYALFGVLWILISDQVLEMLVGEGDLYQYLQTIKGWFYVAITAVILYGLVLETLGLYRESQQTLQSTNEQLSDQLLKTRTSEERYQLAVLGSTDSMWEYDHATRRLFSDDRLLRALGYAEDEAHVTSIEEWLRFVDPQHLSDVRATLAKYFNQPQPLVEVTYPMRAKDGSIAWIHTRGYAQIVNGVIQKIGGSHTDITVQRRYEQSLYEMAYTDPLTKLPNWNRFSEIFDEWIAQDPSGMIVLAYVDIDDFKNINDVYGFKTGDQLLVQVADDLNKRLGHDRIVAKLGGDSFGILRRLDHIPEISEVEQTLLGTINRTRLINGHPLTVTASVGIVVYPHDGHSFLDLMQLADETMYESKRRGKNKISFHDPVTHQERLDTLTLLNQLRQSIVTGNFDLVFQPVIRLEDRETTSIETLVRWNNAQGKPIPPSRFIPLAEKHGLIIPIERWIFKKAFSQLRQWLDQGLNYPVSINLSGVGLTDETFVQEILDMATQLNIPPSAFRMEITETALIENHDFALHQLDHIRHDGVKILLDDFGSGYSSLTYLTQLPIDVIKIDARFVRQLSESPKNQKILRAIITLGHELNCKIIAEGVETSDEAQMLQHLGIRYVQGYLFAKPMDADKLQQYLLTHNSASKP